VRSTIEKGNLREEKQKPALLNLFKKRVWVLENFSIGFLNLLLKELVIE